MSWVDYRYTLRGRIFTFNPNNGMIFFTLGMTDEEAKALKKQLKDLGRAFETEAELNAFAARNKWPKWNPQ